MTKQEFQQLVKDGATPIPRIASSFIKTEVTVADWPPQCKDRIEEVKNFVLSNVSNFPAKQLCDMISKGLLTWQEVKQVQSNITPSEMSKLRSLCGMTTPKTPAAKSSESQSWNALNKRDRFAVDDFIKNNPNSQYQKQARDMLLTLRTDVHSLIEDYVRRNNDVPVEKAVREYLDRGWITKNQLIGEIRNDKNIFSMYPIYSLFQDRYLTINDLTNIGFDEDILTGLFAGNVERYVIPELQTIESRVRNSHDYYFWGTSGSGKSCALGAILSAAANGCVSGCSLVIDVNCQGAEYINVLKGVFDNNGSVGLLPPGTPVGVFAEMGFTLYNNGVRKDITCIDMAGGMLDKLAINEDDLDEDDREIINNLNKIMTNAPAKNKATHIFLLEYKPGDTSIMADKLDKAIAQIQKLDLLKKTEELLILVTKVDKIGAGSNDELRRSVQEYVTRNFIGFYNQLGYICKRNQINDGNVRVIPFNIGKVEMQNYCIFDSTFASNFVKNVFLK